MKEFFNKLGEGIVILCEKVSGIHAFIILLVGIVCFTGYKIVDSIFDSYGPAPVPENYVAKGRTLVQRINLEERSTEIKETTRRTNVQPKSR